MPLETPQVPPPAPPQPEIKRSPARTILVAIGALFIIFIVVIIVAGIIYGLSTDHQPVKTDPVYYTYTSTPVYSVTTTQIAGHGTISVKSSPGGAQVFVNGHFQGTTPADGYSPLLINEIDPGSVTVELRKSGYIFQDQIVTVREGGVATVSMSLEKVPIRKN